MRRILNVKQPSRLLADCSCLSRPAVVSSIGPASTTALAQHRHHGAQQHQQQQQQSRSFSQRPGGQQKAESATKIPPRVRRTTRRYTRRNGEVDDYLPEHDPDADLVDADVDFSIKAPGRLRSTPRQADVDDPFYTPATSGEGLEEVGGVAGWWEDDRHWSPSLGHVGFGPREPITDPAVLEALARRAAVETLAVREVLGPEALGGGAVWQEGGADEMRMALECQVFPRDTGGVGLDGHVTTIVDHLMKPRADEPEQTQPDVLLDAQQAAEYSKSWGKNWKTISLEDPRVKFAVNKRVQQLTGHVIPDHKLLNVRTMGGYLDVLVRPPPPKKLAEVLEQKGELQSLPNVAVYTRRVTPIDKQKMVGRWKVIVDELEKRDLPVVGTGGLPGNSELKWAKGKS